MSVAEKDYAVIRDVWHDNMEVEMANIREMIVNYPIISMVRAAPSRAAACRHRDARGDAALRAPRGPRRAAAGDWSAGHVGPVFLLG